MEITKSQGQECLNNNLFNFSLWEKKEHKREYDANRYLLNKKGGVDFDFSKRKKTRKEINHNNYLKKQEERKEKERIYYSENKEEIKEKKRTKYKSEKISLNNDFLFRRACNNTPTEKALIKDGCFCYSDRKNKRKLLFCSLDTQDKRLGAFNKSPSVNGLGWNEPTYKEKNNWQQLLSDNKFNQVGIRGGKKLGLGFDYWDDSDLMNKDWYKKNSELYKENWREKRLLSNFDRGIKKIKVIYAKTRHGRRINVNACCEWPRINFFHIDPWKKRKAIIGDCRGKNSFTVIDGKDYQWNNEGKLSWRFRCKQEQPKEGQEVGEIKTCLQQYIEAKKLLFFVDCVVSNEKKPILSKKPREKQAKLNELGLFITTGKISSKKPVINKATAEYEPWQVNYLNENQQNRYFILNNYRGQQNYLLDNVFLENSTHNLQLYQGNHQVFFKKIC